MTHRSEQILVAVESKILGLETTKNKVYRDLVFDIKEFPALSLEYIREERVSTLSTDLADWNLFFSIDIHVKAENYSTIINLIRSEITIALMADITQGLDFVIDTDEIDLDSPNKSFSSEKPTASQSMNWVIMYRRNRSTPE